MTEEKRCPFCGRVIRTGVNGNGSKSSPYCFACRHEGYDGIHQATGKTNGWNKKARAKEARPEGGWRGAPVIGDGVVRKRIALPVDYRTYRPTDVYNKDAKPKKNFGGVSL